MDYQEFTATELLGSLNDVEQKLAPKLLFAAGDVSMLQRGPRVAVVGSRKASAESLGRARKLAKLLAQRDIVVVSGLAEGIDTAAHTSALDCSGRTLAVIGTPLDEVYPKKNAKLQERLMDEQLVISQFAVGCPTQRKNFPLRNRTMALIADATVIVEASDSSGSLSQGWEALRLGRGLFITQAVAKNPELTWPKEMQHYGAIVLTDENADYVFDDLPQRSGIPVNGGAVPF
jgi:DNA processing protein